jgi:Lamin Tail Domain/Bacterial Ig-like domain
MNSPCSQNGGTVCSATGQCVQCNGASQCPGADTECAHRTCSANSCGVFYFPNGAQSPVQTLGDCLVNVCDGIGGVSSSVNTGDTPFDGNDCTHDVCNGATPENSPEPAGTPCNQNGGSVCNGIESTCVVPPQVVSTSPASGSSVPATATISVTFNHAMDPMSLTAQMSTGACSGTLQVSLDNFASCVAFSAVAAAMSGGNTIATIVARPGLLLNRTFKLRVTTLAHDASGLDLPSTFTLATGFTTTGGPNFCDGSIVISQIYGGGGNAGAVYKNDFIELHNRGTAPVSVAGYSVQYASAAGSTWTVTSLSGSIAAGGYYLVHEGSGGTNGATLPTPNAIGTTNLSASTGKIALVASTTPLPLGCTLSGVFDFVGYGATANCNEGGTNSPAGANDVAISRNQGGCGDLDLNDYDFAASVPDPRNGASSPKVCACVSQNETGSLAEADHCAVNFPLSITVQAGSPTGAISGQVYESSVTESAGPSPLVRAQLGYGPRYSNPEYQAGWAWFEATWIAQVGDYDEYHLSLPAPAVGSYRYAYRVSTDQGVSWTYCDNNQGDSGAGWDPGLTFDWENVAVLTVTP